MISSQKEYHQQIIKFSTKNITQGEPCNFINTNKQLKNKKNCNWHIKINYKFRYKN